MILACASAFKDAAEIAASALVLLAAAAFFWVMTR